MKCSSNKSVKKENIFFIMMLLFGDAEQAYLCRHAPITGYKITEIIHTPDSISFLTVAKRKYM
jgi:hypothetical protein